MNVSKHEFSHAELKMIVMGVMTIKEDAQEGLKIPNIGTETRKSFTEMITTADSILTKLANVANNGVMFAQIEPYKPGDEELLKK